MVVMASSFDRLKEMGIYDNSMLVLRDTKTSLDRVFYFRKDETIHTEISQKYDKTLIFELASASGFVVNKAFVDTRNYFTDQVWVCA